jgi:branched-chain amino acid transport system ATP-binding protein
MTVLENLMTVPAGQNGENLVRALFDMGAVARREREIRGQAEEVLDFLRLDHQANELAGNLSGGQKKLLELGRTMMAEPRIVLLDEPGAGVNPTLLGELSGMIERLNRERGYTFCIIEHKMDLIARLCDPVIVMVEGSVLIEGSMTQVRADPRVQDAYLGGATVD